jgi:hypothetical protein
MKIKLCSLYLVIASLSFWGCKKEGPAGKNALVDQIAEPAGEHCASGGFKIITGIDDNRNNVLDSNEIQKTEYVCKGIYNKETIIYFPFAGGFGTTSTNGFIYDPIRLIDFNLANYPADSISDSAFLLTYDANVKCIVELYDLTNNKVINNTMLTSNSQADREFKATTVNFLNDLPKSPIKLGFRVKSEKEGTNVYFTGPVMRIFKK